MLKQDGNFCFELSGLRGHQQNSLKIYQSDLNFKAIF